MKAVIIDDELAMHLILKRMLGKIDKVEVVGSFKETASAFSFLQRHQVDLVFVDIHMPGESGLDFARRLRDHRRQMKLVFVTSHKEYALSAFGVYAYDYIVKPISQKRLNETVERALSEEAAHTGREVQMALPETLPPLIEPLTKRETEVLQLIGNGMSNKEIAQTFVLSEGTVKSYVVNIFGKLQVKNRVQAAIVGRMHKLIE